jgi:hypothetical protein
MNSSEPKPKRPEFAPVSSQIGYFMTKDGGLVAANPSAGAEFAKFVDKQVQRMATNELVPKPR